MARILVLIALNIVFVISCCGNPIMTSPEESNPEKLLTNIEIGMSIDDVKLYLLDHGVDYEVYSRADYTFRENNDDIGVGFGLTNQEYESVILIVVGNTGGEGHLVNGNDLIKIGFDEKGHVIGKKVERVYTGP